MPKLEHYFKYFCFGLAGLTFSLTYSSLLTSKAFLPDYLGNIGLILICIEMGVLMSYEQLTAKVTLKNFFTKSNSIQLSAIGIFAHILGKIGFLFLVVSFVIGFFE